MIEIILRNLATTYYPQGICAINNYKSYIVSFEFKNLIEKVNTTFAIIIEKNLDELILDELKRYQTLVDIEDITLESSDRCLSFKKNFFEEETLYQLHLNISIIAPYYYVYVTKNNVQLKPYKWLNLPERSKEAEIRFNNEITYISDIIEQKFLFNKFPDDLVNTVIPNINYADAELGSFTYFNAFFLNDVTL
jgi:hypothetical protein